MGEQKKKKAVVTVNFEFDIAEDESIDPETKTKSFVMRMGTDAMLELTREIVIETARNPKRLAEGDFDFALGEWMKFNMAKLLKVPRQPMSESDALELTNCEIIEEDNDDSSDTGEDERGDSPGGD